MGRCFIASASLALATILNVATLGGASTEPAAPKDNQGFTTSKTQVVELGPEIDGMTGRQLRLRELHIAPGGHIGIHSHKDRPSVVYFLKGTDTVTSADGTKKVFHPGDTTTATKDTTHWHKNDGSDEVVFIAVDVFHNTK